MADKSSSHELAFLQFYNDKLEEALRSDSKEDVQQWIRVVLFKVGDMEDLELRNIRRTQIRITLRKLMKMFAGDEHIIPNAQSILDNWDRELNALGKAKLSNEQMVLFGCVSKRNIPKVHPPAGVRRCRDESKVIRPARTPSPPKWTGVDIPFTPQRGAAVCTPNGTVIMRESLGSENAEATPKRNPSKNLVKRRLGSHVSKSTRKPLVNVTNSANVNSKTPHKSLQRTFQASLAKSLKDENKTPGMSSRKSFRESIRSSRLSECSHRSDTSMKSTIRVSLCPTPSGVSKLELKLEAKKKNWPQQQDAETVMHFLEREFKGRPKVEVEDDEVFMSKEPKRKMSYRYVKVSVKQLRAHCKELITRALEEIPHHIQNLYATLDSKSHSIDAVASLVESSIHDLFGDNLKLYKHKCYLKANILETLDEDTELTMDDLLG